MSHPYTIAHKIQSYRDCSFGTLCSIALPFSIWKISLKKLPKSNVNLFFSLAKLQIKLIELPNNDSYSTIDSMCQHIAQKFHWIFEIVTPNGRRRCVIWYLTEMYRCICMTFNFKQTNSTFVRDLWSFSEARSCLLKPIHRSSCMYAYVLISFAVVQNKTNRFTSSN